MPKKTSWGKIAKLCMLQTVAQYLFFYIGLANTSGVKASIIEGVNVFISILVASLIFHQERLTTRKMAGCLIGFAGVVLVNITGGIDMAFTFTGDGFIVLSTIAYAFSSVMIKRYSQGENPVTLSGYQFVLGGLIMVICGLLMGGRLEVITPAGIAMLLYLAVISAVAYSFMGHIVKVQSRIKSYGVRVYESCVWSDSVSYIPERIGQCGNHLCCGIGTCLCGNLYCE